MKVYRHFLLAAFAILAAGAWAQHSTTPYSRIGYGMLGDNATGAQRSMGGVGYAMQSGRQINVMNPASYSQVDSLTFLWDIGFDMTNLWSKEQGKSGYSFGGGLDYITAEFRLAKHLGASFGVVPFSSVGYTFGAGIDNGSESRSGSGGISELYIGAGYEPVKGLSLGFNVSYMFGTTVNTNVIATGTSQSRFERVMEVRDWNLHTGAQYRFDINNTDNVVLGATYSPRKSMHGHTWGTRYDSSQDESTSVEPVGYTSLKGKYETPATYGAGLSFTHGYKFFAEADFTYQQWSKAKYTPLDGFEAPAMTLDDRWKVAAGLQFTPAIRGNYLKRISYRLGAHFNHDYININGSNVRDYGVALGFGLPALGSKTIVNLGVEWKHRYTKPVGMIKEDYLNITLSLNFNELWFWKNRIR